MVQLVHVNRWQWCQVKGQNDHYVLHMAWQSGGVAVVILAWLQAALVPPDYLWLQTCLFTPCLCPKTALGCKWGYTARLVNGFGLHVV